jgi:type II secretory pathway pseudopilin PulG
MKQSAFTLLEILITFALLMILIVTVIVLLNPTNLLGKGLDARRKYDLNMLKKKLEEFNNDKNCYPKLNEVCYQGGKNGTLNLVNDSITSCFICGNNPASPSFKPYLDTLPCDPESEVHDYLYTIASKQEKDCPQSYAIYSVLSATDDLDSISIGCLKGGCGPNANYGYDYGVSSPNTKPIASNQYYCRMKTGSCNRCSSPVSQTPYSDCLQNINCGSGVFSTFSMCCSSFSPKPLGC